MDDEKDKEVQAAIKSERSRGSKRPVDSLSFLERLELRSDVRELLRRETTEEDVIASMRALGVPDERFPEALRIRRALRRSA